MGAEGSNLGTSPTVQELIEEYLEKMPVTPPNALEKQPGFITSQSAAKNRTNGRHAIRKLGHIRVSELTMHQVESGLNSLIANGRGASTARLAKIVLKAAMDDAVRLGFVDTNPVVGARLIKPLKKPVSAPDEGTVEEMWEIIEERMAVKLRGPGTNPLLIPIIEMLLETGMRIRELTALVWGAIDLESRTVRVEATMVEGDGALRRQTWPKTSDSRRTLHFSESYAEDLAELYKQKGSPGANGPVFPSPKKGGHTAPGSARKTLDRILGRAGVEKIRLHGLRKSVATATESHFGLESAAKQLGHADTRTTKEFYVGPSSQTLDLTVATAGFRRKKQAS